LKPGCAVPAWELPLHFRGAIAAASLKHQDQRAGGHLRSDFRGVFAAASLKLIGIHALADVVAATSSA
jgi:hypothetical protein